MQTLVYLVDGIDHFIVQRKLRFHRWMAHEWVKYVDSKKQRK
jgi:hypothetical protein